MTIFKLPDLGEGLPDAEISEWHVKVGDHVDLDQSLVSMETAKAVVEVPSPFSGQIKKLYGEKGDIIKTGLPLVEYERENVSETTQRDETQTNHAHSDLDTHSNRDSAATVAGKLEVGTTILKESPIGIVSRSPSPTIKATPAIRALAQRLNVNLGSITPTGPHGTFTTQDVERAAQSSLSSLQHNQKDFDVVGSLEPLKGVRRAMAQAMIQSHAQIVPVTVMDDAKLPGWNEKQDITVRLIQAICDAAKKEPALNAWFDTQGMGRYLAKHVNLGIAVDTPEGLFVPVIHQAESQDATALRQKIDALKKQVSDRSIRSEDLRGATFTLSNFGKFAGRYANPLIVPPTVAILGVGSLREEVVAIKGQATVCPVLPLALTFDHRAVTGGEATRFLGAVIEALEKG